MARQLLVSSGLLLVAAVLTGEAYSLVSATGYPLEQGRQLG